MSIFSKMFKNSAQKHIQQNTKNLKILAIKENQQVRITRATIYNIVF